MTGSCKPGKQEHKSSDPLALEQFLSAFLLLMSGILLAALLLFLEHIYFKYVRQHLAKSDQGGCCALISLVIKCLIYLKKSPVILRCFIHALPVAILKKIMRNFSFFQINEFIAFEFQVYSLAIANAVIFFLLFD